VPSFSTSVTPDFFQEKGINAYTPPERVISSIEGNICEQGIQFRYGLAE
jgi:hypothetical protein